MSSARITTLLYFAERPVLGTQNSPAMYFSNARVPAITSSVQRVGSSSRPVHRSSDVDFDEVPSPRRRMSGLSNGRQSLGLGFSPGPSRLSVATLREDLADGIEVDFGDNVPYDDDSDNEPMASPPPQPTRRTSFTQMDQDEDEEPEEEQVEEELNHRTPTSAKAKGKQRQIQPYEDEEMPDAGELFDDDGDLGLPDVGEALEEVEEEVEEDREETPKPKKSRPPPRSQS